MNTPDRSVLARLAEHAARTPDRPCLIHGRRLVSYGEFRDASLRVARALVEEGIEPGARVALILENSPDFALAYQGTLSAGAVAVPLNPNGPPAAIESVFRDCRPRAAFVGAAIAPAVLAIASRLPGFKCFHMAAASAPAEGMVNVEGLTEGPARTPSPDRDIGPAPDPDALALIVYTSGTTGTPKGVRLSHANLREIAMAGQQLFDVGPADRLGAVVPLFHLYGLREIDLTLWAGAALVIPRDTHFLAAVLNQLHDARVTGLASVPSALTLLVDRYHAELRVCGEHLRYLAIGTAPAPARLRAALRDLLPTTRLVVTYGLTEASRVCWADISDPGSPSDARNVGRPYSGVTLRLVDESGGVGRVALHSGMVMAGYWNQPEATRRVVTNDAYLLTPDCGRFEPDGTLHLLGRIDDVINCGGQKVSPDEVEEVLADYPGVAAVTVLGAADPAGVLGQVVHAMVIAESGTVLDASALRAHAASRLAPYKVPARIEFVDAIPKSLLGKPQRARLREVPT